MIEIQDKRRIEEYLKRERIRERFDTKELEFQAFQYEKGEYITSPNTRLNALMFVVEGTVRIYGIRENGSISPVNHHRGSCLLGDVEFSTPGESTFYVEAKTPVVCVALPMERYRAQLDCDVRFLHMLLNAYAEKLKLFAMLDTAAPRLEERVLVYLENICPNGELDSVDAAVLQLHCSRRQMQRVLKKLCAEEKIARIGKGRYRLN